MNQPGNYPFGQDGTSTAFHEAGHAVAAIQLRRSFRYVTIVENNDSLGHVQFIPPGPWFRPDMEVDGRTRRRVEQLIQIGWAGPEAEARFREWPDEGEAMPGAESDLAGIVNLGLAVCGSDAETEAFVEWLRLRTTNLLRSPIVWAAVEAVALALVQTPRLTYRQCRELVEKSRQAHYDDLLRKAQDRGVFRDVGTVP